jgi:uroporphyrinogen III methyltransferase/synthase
VTLVPDEHQAQALAEKIVQTIEVRGKRFLLPLAQGARQVLEQRLAASGAAVQRVTAYRTLAVTEPPGQFAARLTRGKFDVVTFASSSAVSFFLERLGPQLANQARGCYTVACIGPSTSQTARESGLQVAIEAAPHTARGLIEAIIRHYGAS